MHSYIAYSSFRKNEVRIARAEQLWHSAIVIGTYRHTLLLESGCVLWGVSVVLTVGWLVEFLAEVGSGQIFEM